MLKKIIALVLLVGCILSMTSCGIAANAIYSQLYKDYEEEDFLFTYENFSITLTDAFYTYMSEEGYCYLYTATQTDAEIYRYDYTNSEINANMTFEEQVELVRGDYYIPCEGEVSLYQNVSAVQQSDGLYYFTYDMIFVPPYKGIVFYFADKDALWELNFSCYFYSYDEHLPYFFKWARSVKIENVHTQA